MNYLEHIEGVAQYLRKETAQAERKGRLTDKQLQIIYKYKWFKLFVPEEFNGLALPLPVGLRIQEALAVIDGSLAWTVTLCSGANMFVGYLDKEMATSLFQDEKVCFGGSGKASGTAEIMEDGYLITGKWNYATGAPHNTAFTANCQLVKNGSVITNQDGEPIIKSFLFLKDEVKLISDWDTMGLHATAGYTFEVKDLMVDKNRCFEINRTHTTRSELVYNYPFQQFAETTLAVNTLGMGMRFLSCCETIFKEKYTKNNDIINGLKPLTELKKARNRINNLRNLFFNSVDSSWGQLTSKGMIEEALQLRLTTLSRKMVRTIRRDIALLYPYCGMRAAETKEEINQIWRNIFTASQHTLLL